MVLFIMLVGGIFRSVMHGSNYHDVSATLVILLNISQIRIIDIIASM